LTSRILSKVFSMLLLVAASLAYTRETENCGIQWIAHASTTIKECGTALPD
jgi:hypothetical protein